MDTGYHAAGRVSAKLNPPGSIPEASCVERTGFPQVPPSSGSESQAAYRRVCPGCGLKTASLAHRKKLGEQFLSLAGIRPFYCENCQSRFHRFRAPRRLVPISWAAHCPRCTFTGVEKVSKDRVPHILRNVLWRLLDIPAYRCPECRTKFFSILPRKKLPGQES